MNTKENFDNVTLTFSRIEMTDLIDSTSRLRHLDEEIAFDSVQETIHNAIEERIKQHPKEADHYLRVLNFVNASLLVLAEHRDFFHTVTQKARVASNINDLAELASFDAKKAENHLVDA